jgi:prepilin-type N-terminal cleavage/methylation domain-containing protein
MKSNQKGFSVVEILIVIVVVGLLGAVGWQVYDRQKSETDSKNTTTQTSQQEQKQESPKAETSSYTTLKLASEKVQFEIPKTWIVGKSNCIDSPGATPVCADGATITPPEKMPTIYGGGTEYFTIYANVYENKDNKTAQRWFEDVYQGGSSSGNDKVSNEKINGYDTYYFRQIDTSYDEIRYICSANGKAVLVTARVSEKHFAPDGSGKVDDSSDFTKYIPEIEKMAKTIKFN